MATSAAVRPRRRPEGLDARSAAPLSTVGIAWFAERYLASPADGDDRRIAIQRDADVGGVVPATDNNADIDPPRSDGRYCAEKLDAAGVDTERIPHPGVALEFFGMMAVQPEARDAVARATTRLRESFAAAGR